MFMLFLHSEILCREIRLLVEIADYYLNRRLKPVGSIALAFDQQCGQFLLIPDRNPQCFGPGSL